MVVKRKEMKHEIREHLRGGEGSVEMIHALPPEAMKNCRLFCEIDIPVGAGIGEHEHLNETEYYVILEGSAVVNDDGREVAVAPGDVIATGGGARHSLKNTGTVPVRLIAFIITY
jgi:mannose-6-phosphate isomerase-like protein (cupin superfamily)